MWHRVQLDACCCPLNIDFLALRVQGCATERRTRHTPAPSTVYVSPRACCRRGRVAETPEELRKSGERGSGRRCREERRVSEGRYVDFKRSDDGGVKGLS